MFDLIVVMVGAAAVVLLWRVFKPRLDPADMYVLAISGHGHGTGGGAEPSDLHHWQSLGRFDFAIVDCARHQVALRAVLEESGPLCMATLHASKEVGSRVEVRVGDQRVGFLSDGDATRFQRRLAFEGRPGQTSQCGARIVVQAEGDRQTCTILLDLKPFRH
ncbi:hypothetical protein [Pseudorhodoferax sp.]|uniref:hypothetical protein n=1 Tax=Pseudorhodoferax sp. TaxID=1993553 RepID=UPI002DD62AAB|nr:hypothetical protein [Pseudorhodoferax sp.]